jgi:cell division protein FtsI (penicillin-binding protein 3)
MNNKNQYQASLKNWRHYFVMLCGLGLFAVLLLRLLQLQILETDFLQHESDKRTVRDHSLSAYRGMIVDRNNEPLAVSTPVKSIWLNPKQVLQDKSDVSELAALLNVSVTSLINKIKKNKHKEFIYLRRHMNPGQANKINKLNIAGVGLKQEFKRFYPAAEVTSHVVGFTNIDEAGIEGVELAFDQWLQGQPGKGRVIKDRLGRLVKDLGVVEPAQAGNELTLSLDLRLQYQAYRELKASVQQHGAKAGSLIMLDTETGEILALVNQPAFNPNNRSELKATAVRNRTITDMFEPGSTVKPFTVAAALLSGNINKQSVVDTHPGYLRLDNKTIRDHRNYGKLDITEILTRSSNVGVSKLALQMGGENLWHFYRQLGLGEPVGLGLQGENGGKVAVGNNRWGPLETATLSYGYGLAVTPLQLAQAYQVLANDGIKQPLTLLRRQPGELTQGKQVLPKSIANDVVKMLQTVVGPKGTARRARVDGYLVAGKTGTVHKVGSEGYKDESYLSLFAGVAPADDPKVVTIVVIDEPSGREYYGGEVAAPIYSRVMQSSLRLMNVLPSQSIENVALGGLL